MTDAEAFDQLLVAVSGSRSYREAVSESLPGLPGWLVPFSIVDGPLLSRIATECAVGTGDAVLDLACGAGGPGLRLAELTGANLAGVDHAPGAVRLARELAVRLGMGARTRYDVASATALPHPDRSFRAVASVDALMFVDAASAASEIARVLAPGGRFVATVAESLVEPFLPTLVRDYGPIFERAGFRTLVHEPERGHAERSRRFYEAIERRARALHDEIGAAAESLLEEARGSLARGRDGTQRVRHVLFVAERLDGRDGSPLSTEPSSPRAKSPSPIVDRTRVDRERILPMPRFPERAAASP